MSLANILDKQRTGYEVGSLETDQLLKIKQNCDVAGFGGSLNGESYYFASGDSNYNTIASGSSSTDWASWYTGFDGAFENWLVYDAEGGLFVYDIDLYLTFQEQTSGLGLPANVTATLRTSLDDSAFRYWDKNGAECRAPRFSQYASADVTIASGQVGAYVKWRDIQFSTLNQTEVTTPYINGGADPPIGINDAPWSLSIEIANSGAPTVDMRVNGSVTIRKKRYNSNTPSILDDPPSTPMIIRNGSMDIQSLS